MKISIVTTVYNEEQTIAKLLDSLISQTKKADEIVIVDGGSKDKTVSIIRKYQKHDERIRLLIDFGNIAHGRNVAITHARFPIIAMLDAGCIAKEDWFENITKPFQRNDTMLVAGFYSMTGNSLFQQAIKPFLGIPEERFNSETFLPSARSMAFRKSAWGKIGGFSENLEKAGEDTLFNYNVLKAGIRIVRVKDAIVFWEVPKTLRENVKKFYLYAKGDAQSGIWWNPVKRRKTHSLKIVTVLARYLLGLLILIFAFFLPWLFLLLIFGFSFYLFWVIFKMRDVVKDTRARLWLPAIQIASDFAVMTGFVSGIIYK